MMIFQRVKGLDGVLFYFEIVCFKVGGKEFANIMFAVGDGWDFNELAM